MRTLVWGEHQIEYELRREERGTLAVTVRPDQSVLVQAPPTVAEEAIERRIVRRAAWILRQQRFFEQFEPRTPPREYVRGESHLYLGRKYRLRLAEAGQRTVELSGGYLVVRLPQPANGDAVREALWAWYSAQARELFPQRLERCMRTAAGRKLPPPRLQIRRMQRRWGSCTPSGTLILNTTLIRAPRTCIDYVITHELCHLRHADHSPEFYRLLSLAIPDWEERKTRLERLLS
jgi:predicted metal-dependent hydrolase